MHCAASHPGSPQSVLLTEFNPSQVSDCVFDAAKFHTACISPFLQPAYSSALRCI